VTCSVSARAPCEALDPRLLAIERAHFGFPGRERFVVRFDSWRIILDVVGRRRLGGPRVPETPFMEQRADGRWGGVRLLHHRIEGCSLLEQWEEFRRELAVGRPTRGTLPGWCCLSRVRHRGPNRFDLSRIEAPVAVACSHGMESLAFEPPHGRDRDPERIRDFRARHPACRGRVASPILAHHRRTITADSLPTSLPAVRTSAAVMLVAVANHEGWRQGCRLPRVRFPSVAIFRQGCRQAAGSLPGNPLRAPHLPTPISKQLTQARR
jgi:hypothetical protein